MVYLETQLPQIIFPSELSFLTIVATAGEQSVDVAVRIDSSDILAETLYFDADGRVNIYDVGDYVTDYMTAPRLVPLRLSVGDDTYTCSVVPNAVESTVAAEQWVRSSFLTPLAGDKRTAPDGREHLLVYCPDGNEAVRVTARFCTDDSLVVTAAAELPDAVKAATLTEIDVSPNRIAAVLPSSYGKLVAYQVNVGERVQRYTLCEGYSSERMLLFRNSFLSVDSFYFAELEREMKPARSIASVGGRKRVYHLEQTDKYQATSFPLTDEELLLADDVACSRSAWLPDGTEVMITENELKYTSDPSVMPRLTLTWEYPSNRLRHKPYARAVFDETFDKTHE